MVWTFHFLEAIQLPVTKFATHHLILLCSFVAKLLTKILYKLANVMHYALHHDVFHCPSLPVCAVLLVQVCNIMRDLQFSASFP